MTDDIPTPDPAPEPTPSATPPAKRRRHPVLRALGILVAVVAAFLISGLVIDLGPAARGRAEELGSKYLERPMHIGKLGIQLGKGAFVVEDLVIEGLKPTDRPFLKAKKIFVNFPWWTIFTHQMIVESSLISFIISLVIDIEKFFSSLLSLPLIAPKTIRAPVIAPQVSPTDIPVPKGLAIETGTLSSFFLTNINLIFLDNTILTRQI